MSPSSRSLPQILGQAALASRASPLQQPPPPASLEVALSRAPPGSVLRCSQPEAGGATSRPWTPGQGGSGSPKGHFLGLLTSPPPPALQRGLPAGPAGSPCERVMARTSCSQVPTAAQCIPLPVKWRISLKVRDSGADRSSNRGKGAIGVCHSFWGKQDWETHRSVVLEWMNRPTTPSLPAAVHKD